MLHSHYFHSFICHIFCISNRKASPLLLTFYLVYVQSYIYFSHYSISWLAYSQNESHKDWLILFLSSSNCHITQSFTFNKSNHPLFFYNINFLYVTSRGKSYGNMSTEVFIGFDMSSSAYYCKALALNKKGTIPF